jgi:xylan 1,4-beta-xylosidase
MRGRGRIALPTSSRKYLAVKGSGSESQIGLISGKPGDAETFQWVDLQRGDTLLLSLATCGCAEQPGRSGG